MAAEETTHNLVLAGRPFSLHQALSGMHCGGRLWESGLTLTRFLEQERGQSLRLFKDQRVLELGAGLGACGLVCAIQGQCKEIVLTDQAEVLPHLKKNVRLLDSDEQRVVKVMEFNWGSDPIESGLEPPYSVVLAADCIYEMALIQPFLKSLKDVTDSKSIIFICNETRDVCVANHFLEELAKDFTIKEIKSSKLAKLKDAGDYSELIKLYKCKAKS